MSTIETEGSLSVTTAALAVTEGSSLIGGKSVEKEDEKEEKKKSKQKQRREKVRMRKLVEREEIKKNEVLTNKKAVVVADIPTAANKNKNGGAIVSESGTNGAPTVKRVGLVEKQEVPNTASKEYRINLVTEQFKKWTSDINLVTEQFKKCVVRLI